MKIAVIGAKGLPARQGGIERYCEEIYPRIVQCGHSVDLFSRSKYDGGTLWKYDFQGVNAISLPSVTFKRSDAFVNSLTASILTTGNSYDIIHIHALGPAIVSCVSRFLTSSKVVVTCHGLDWKRAKWGNFSTRMILQGEKNAVRYAHKIAVVSEDLRSYFLETYGLDTVYIPNAPGAYVEADPQFAYGTSIGLKPKRYLLFLGRLVPEKRLDLIIQAFKRIEPGNWKLAIAGGASDTREYVEELHNIAGDNKNIIFLGELHGRYLSEVMQNAGLFVLPSDLEGLPLVLLEAMQEGVPVVASDIPPHQQLIGTHRGTLFKAGDLDSCSQALEWALDNPSELAERAHQAQKHVRLNYNWERVVADTLQLYHDLLSKPSSPELSEYIR